MRPRHISVCRGFAFQDIAKVGLKFGDEGQVHSQLFRYDRLIEWADVEEEEERAQQEELKEKYQPLIQYLKLQASDVVRDGRNVFPDVSRH
jgi:heat shock protein 90kDa beta